MNIKDKESWLILWNLPNDKTLELNPEFDDLLTQSGLDPFDLESISKLFNCNVTRVTETKESFHK